MSLAAVMDLYSRSGNCHDNVVAESFFSLLKKERIKRRIYPGRAAASSDAFDYIETLYDAVCQDGFHCRSITGRVRATLRKNRLPSVYGNLGGPCAASPIPFTLNCRSHFMSSSKVNIIARHCLTILQSGRRRSVIISVVALALVVCGSVHGRDDSMKPQNRLHPVTLGFSGGPAIRLCVPDEVSTSFLPANQSIALRVAQMPDGSVRFVHRDKKADQSGSQLLVVAAYISAASWQEVVARHRAAPGSARIGEFVFKSIDPFVDLDRYFAVSTSRPVNFFVDLRSASGTSVERRRAQLTAIADSISGYLNATECN
jgi:hypothetical protein